MKIFIGIKAIANFVGYSEAHTTVFIEQGRLPAYKNKRKRWVSNSVSLRQWMADRLVGVKAIANFVGYSEQHTRLMIKQGNLPAYKDSMKWIGNRVILRKWLEKRKTVKDKKQATYNNTRHDKYRLYNRGFALNKEIMDWLNSECERTGDGLNKVFVRVLLKEVRSDNKTIEQDS